MKELFFEKAIKSNSLIGIRTLNQDWDEVIIGFIVETSDTSLTINEVDENGALSGKTTVNLSDIINLDYSDRYQKRLKYIYDNREKLKSNDQISIWKDGADLLSDINNLIKNKKITTFYFNEDNYVVGIPLNHDDYYLSIKNIGVEGDEDGESLYLIENLIGLRFDGVEEQKIELLFKNSKSFYQ